MERKNFLRTFAVAAAAGPMLLDACGKSASTSTSSTTTTTGSSSTTTSESGSCTVTPTETEGPYPYPSGEINDPLNRTDITGGQTGIPISYTFLVVNTNNSCAVVSGARVDIWHCNKDGYYSGYSNQAGILGTESYVGETWLRGYEVTNSYGIVTFSSIYPGWYSPRATHVHLEIYIDSVLKKTTQLAFPESISNVVQVSTLYAAHGTNPTTNSTDSVFGDSATDLANEMLSLTGSLTAGYAGTYTIGLAL